MAKTDLLFEREEQIRSLEEVIAETADSGRVVLLSGEAGFGKSSLLGAFVEGLDHRYRVLTASCEPVGIPAAFAPLFDLLDELPDELRQSIRNGADRPTVYAGMLDLIKNDRIVLIFEDVHWADEATLGLIRYLGRRIEASNSALIITFRTEELPNAPRLRLVVADLGPIAARVELPALTPAAVGQMADGLGLDPVEVYAATQGNPFFVEEVIRNPDVRLPPTIGNAVLASADQLPQGALDILYLVALHPEGVDMDLIEAQDTRAGSNVDLAVQRRLLVSSDRKVTCRHDLIRESLLQAIPPAQKRSLHRRLLSFLEDRIGDSPDIARLAYHSIGAGETEKAVSYSLRAARDASRSGAHRQSAFHYSNALELRARMTPIELELSLLEAAKEHCLVNAFDVSSELARQRVDGTATPIEEGRARAWLAYFESRKNDLKACRREAELAIEALAGEGPSEELALALFVRSWVELVEGDYEQSIVYADQATDTARAAGSVWVEVLAAANAGGSRLELGDPAGLTVIEEAARLGVEAGAEEPAARALAYLATATFRSQRLAEASSRFGEAIEYTTSRELDAWYIAALTTVASINVSSGNWDEADKDLERVLGQRTCIQTEVEMLIAAATLRARRGDPGSTEIIEDVLERTRDSGDHDVSVTVCALAMEAAWLDLIDPGLAIYRYEAERHSSALANDNWGRGLMAFWAYRLGLPVPAGHVPGPAGREWRGQSEEAARQWEERGFPVEAAIVGATLPDADLDSVFSDLARLGAEGVIRGLRRELHRRGVKRIPRGDRPATRQNPAGLTTRQAEVLGLIAAGLSNADIAERLFISEKTASHHVSAVLAKLNASSRLQAAAIATANGLVGSASRASL